MLEKAVNLSSGDRTRARLGFVYAESNKRSKALKILDDLIEQSKQR